jgi:hypothetical protein
MVRTQVQLTKQQLDSLRQLSAESGRSVAELIRLGVDLYLSSQHRVTPEDKMARALKVVGRFSSGLKDVGVRHDDYLAEDFGK